MDTFSVSVIIPTYRRKEKLLKALHSLKEASWKNVNLDVVVVNDDFHLPCMSKKEQANLAKFFPIRVIQGKGCGPSLCRNIGIQRSRYDNILFMDDDVTIRSNFFKLLRLAWIQNKSSHAILPKIEAVCIDGTLTRYDAMKVRLFDWCYVNTSFGDKSRVLSKSETMYAACLLVKKSKQIYFEERLGLRLGEFLLGGEDTELSYRLHAQGIKIGYSSQLKAFHGFSKARLTFFYLVRRHCKAGIENAVISSILNREEIFPSFREHMQFLKANTQFFVQYCILNVSYYLFYKLAKKMLSL